MLFWKPNYLKSWTNNNHVSILVLLDVILKVNWIINNHDIILVSILVLLDVILKAREHYLLYRRSGRFNPCFVGCYSERIQYSIYRTKGKWVSILVLLDVILKVCPVCCLDRADQVSILVLLDVILKEKKRPDIIEHAMFQSLFCWMLFWKRASSIRYRWKMRVSILVLLDVILKGGAAHKVFISSLSFNPCFVGCYSERLVRLKLKDLR